MTETKLQSLLKAVGDLLNVSNMGTAQAIDARTLYHVGIALIFVGMVAVLAAITLLFVSNLKDKGKVKGGGALIIGPFPIIFGTDRESIRTVLLLSITLTILLIIAVVIFHLLFG